MNTLQTQNNLDFLERSRSAILNLGYDFVRFRNKTKKKMGLLKTRFIK